MPKLQLNPQITGLIESATLAINLQALRLREEGKKVYHFGFGEAPFPVHPKMQDALIKNVHQKSYLSSLGLPKLRESIAHFYAHTFDLNWHPDDIIIGPGSKELIFQLLYTLEGPLFVPAPSWVSYAPQARIRSKEVVPIITQKENSYKLTAHELEKSCQDFTHLQKILILNNPNNPTGAVYKATELESLAKVCKKHHIIVISDEIYSLINYSGQPFTSMAHFYPEGTITSSGISKSHSAGGYRLGHIHIPSAHQDLKRALCSFISETFSAVSAPIQHAAISAYNLDPDITDYVSHCTSIHQMAGHYLHKRFRDLQLGCPKPEGAFYLFPDFQSHEKELYERYRIQNSEELSAKLLNESGFVALSGSHFYHPDRLLSLRVASVDYDGELAIRKFLKGEKLSTDFVEEYCPNLKYGCDALENFLKRL